MPQISVIVLTYHPDRDKLKRTLQAILRQTDVSFEIIISDDGSGDNSLSDIEDFFREAKFSDYQLVENPVNKGTVRNCLSGLQAAQGEYVFLSSPGDMLFDPYVLRDFYRFAQEHSAKMCFGNAVFYRDGEITRRVGAPARPIFYKPGTPLSTVKTAFFCGDFVTGAVYFRQRQFAVSYITAIADTAVYMEDTTSTALALADDIPLLYYDRNMVWYEDGSGVSTAKSEKWERLLRQDIQRTLEVRKEFHRYDPYVDALLSNLAQTNRWKRILHRLFRHPIIFLRSLICRASPVTVIHYTRQDLERLAQFLK